MSNEQILDQLERAAVILESASEITRLMDDSVSTHSYGVVCLIDLAKSEIDAAAEMTLKLIDRAGVLSS